MIGWVHYEDATRNQTDVLKKYLPKFNTLKFEPNTKAVYSNLNYMVLGAIIEAVSGQSYESYITENILRPLGMSHTSFIYSPKMAKHEAVGTLPVVHFFHATPTSFIGYEYTHPRAGWKNALAESNVYRRHPIYRSDRTRA